MIHEGVKTQSTGQWPFQLIQGLSQQSVFPKQLETIFNPAPFTQTHQTTYVCLCVWITNNFIY